MNKELYDEKLEHLDALNKLLLDSAKSQRETFKALRSLFIAMMISFTLIICSGIFGFFWYESQFETEEVKETTTREVYTEGENSDANIVEGDQYNDSSQHNE